MKITATLSPELAARLETLAAWMATQTRWMHLGAAPRMGDLARIALCRMLDELEEEIDG